MRKYWWESTDEKVLMRKYWIIICWSADHDCRPMSLWCHQFDPEALSLHSCYFCIQFHGCTACKLTLHNTDNTSTARSARGIVIWISAFLSHTLAWHLFRSRSGGELTLAWSLMAASKLYCYMQGGKLTWGPSSALWVLKDIWVAAASLHTKLIAVTRPVWSARRVMLFT